MKKIFNTICDVTLGIYLAEVLFMWPAVVLLVWLSEKAMGYQDFTFKDANAYTWKTWNEIRTTKKLMHDI